MAHADLDTLLNVLLPFAQRQLKKRGGFLPFGATVRSDGSLALADALLNDEEATPENIVRHLEAAFAAEARQGELRACGVCYDGRLQLPNEGAPTDAICVALEHETGEAIEVWVPYKRGFLGRVKLSDLIAQKVEPKTFTTDSRG